MKVPRWEEWERVSTSDMGRGGMGFLSALSLDVGDPVHIRVRIGGGRGMKEAEVVSGKVAWIRPHAFFHIGIVFDPLDSMRHRRLIEITPPGHVGSQPRQTDRLIWKGWIRNLLAVGGLHRRDLLELAKNSTKKP